jgi:hypothetical protein
MDQNTTNINDLPVESNPPDNRELPESQINLNRSLEIEEPPKKRVQFEEPRVEKNKLYEIKETHKVILLASLFFLLFSDLKVKSYVLNILIVILGSSLKTASGSISKIGLVFYSIVYAISLFALVNLIEFASSRLS